MHEARALSVCKCWPGGQRKAAKSTEKQQLVALSVLEEPGLTPSTYTLAHNCKLQSQGIQYPLSGLLGTRHVCDTHMYVQQVKYRHTLTKLNFFPGPEMALRLECSSHEPRV